MPGNYIKKDKSNYKRARKKHKPRADNECLITKNRLLAESDQMDRLATALYDGGYLRRNPDLGYTLDGFNQTMIDALKRRYATKLKAQADFVLKINHIKAVARAARR